MRNMSLTEYENRFTSLTERGKVRINYEKSAQYIGQCKLCEKYKTQAAWIALAEEALKSVTIRSALGLEI